MQKLFSILLLTVFLLSGCSAQKEAPIKLVANSWIGYSPLFYAKEKGWLEPLNIEVSTVVSLGESMMTYRTGRFDGLAGTQYEYQKLNDQNQRLVPVLMFDRSNGGDMVMGNRSISQLQETVDTIDVYLEVNSINSMVFHDFIEAHQLEGKTFNYINKDQLKIVTQIKQKDQQAPALITTYVPYNFELSELGFNTLASTKEVTDIVVLDALYVTEKKLKHNLQTFLELKKVINQALLDLQQDPESYYDLVKPYLENMSYQEFQASLGDIEWLTETIPRPLIEKINQVNFPIKDLL
ncbi:MAG: hypothetical protein U9R28_03205 [Pseudomonadota bacterium]|nr:hypothetical protein [Pseudomonadota bacterium]